MAPTAHTGKEISYEYVRPPDKRVIFHADLLEATKAHIIMSATISPSKPIVIDDVEVVGPGYRAIWFLFKGRPYDVGRFYRPDGTWTGYYADMLEPVQWRGADPHTIQPIVDLFLDLWISPSGECSVLDCDELEEAARQGYLTAAQVQHARQTLQHLLRDERAGRFPPEVVRTYQLRRKTNEA